LTTENKIHTKILNIVNPTRITAITQKRYERGCQLLLITNRKLCTDFRLVPSSMTFNDFERRNSPYFAFFHRIRQIFIISQWLKVDL